MAEKLHDDGLASLYLADARDMSFLEDGSVDCVEDYLKLAIKRLGGPFEVEVEGVKVKQEGLFQ